MTNKSTIFSFFSGSGFLDLGFEMIGDFKVAYVSEYYAPFLDAYKYSRKQLNLQEPRYGYFDDDIKLLTQKNELDRLKDLIVDARQYTETVGFIGGPPCPDFSIGGKNKGEYGDHGKLSASYIDLIASLQPDYFLFENVKGLWKTKKHRLFYEGLKRKVQECGYVTAEKLVNAIEYSVPQNRERIILLGFHMNLIGQEWIGERTFDQSVFPWSVYEKYSKEVVLSADWPTVEPFIIDSEKDCPSGVIRDLTVEHWFRKNNVYNHPNSKHCFKARQGLAKFKSIDEGDDSKKSFKRLHRWRYSPTACYGNNEVHLHPYKPRRISASEALAIQSLPASYSLPPDMTLSSMFKTIGNGVPYLMAKSLASLVSETLSSKKITYLQELSTELKRGNLDLDEFHPKQLTINF